VVIGIILEYKTSFIQLWKHPNLPVLKAFVREALGGILVALGVAGELFFGFLSDRRDNRLRSTNATYIAGLQRQIAELNLLAEQERLARLKLEQRQAPRSLSPDQQKQLSEAIAVGGPKGDVAVIPKTFDEEAEAYATGIKQVLVNGSIPVLDNQGTRPFSWGRSGAFMIVHDFGNPPAHAAFIQGCFRKAGITLDGYGLPDAYTMTGLDPSVVIIAIGAKP
jgi:hypothetical protein